MQFVSCNRLPHDFHFDVYLRRCIRQVFVELLHIHWGIWLAVCMLVQLDLLIHTSFVSPTRLAGSTSGVDFIDYCAIAGVLFTLWLSLIYWKVCLLILILPPSLALALTDCCAAAAAATYTYTTHTTTTLS